MPSPKTSTFRVPHGSRFLAMGIRGYEFRTNGQGSHIGRIEVGNRHRRESFGILLGGTVKEFGDIEDSSLGRMQGTGYPEENFDLKAHWARSPESTVTFAHYYVNQDDIVTLAPHAQQPGLDPRQPCHHSRPLDIEFPRPGTFAQLSALGRGKPTADAAIQKWNATLSYQSADDSEFQNRLPAEDSLRASHIDLETIGLDLTTGIPARTGITGLWLRLLS
jgi:hemoglobin/transferrin/lactoferrin receptor protein